MRAAAAALLRAPAPLLSLLAALLLLDPPLTAANPHPLNSQRAGFSYDELFARWDCSGELCGWNDQLCCSAGSSCYTDSNNQAQCSYGATSAAAGGGGGYWELFTTTYTLTDLQTVTSTGSTYGGAVATGEARCNYALQETPCGDVCCSSDQYCKYVDSYGGGQCAQASVGMSTLTTATETHGSGVTGAAGPPILGTSSGNTITTQTVSPTTTVPYQTPVATGANVTMTEDNNGGGGGLSGGAIAGIVIGVLLGLALLGLLCFCCCVKGLLDGCLALFGIGGRKRKRTEVDEYERRTHHSSRHGDRGRTWYGAAKPSRVERRDRRDSHAGRNAAGILGGLGALWAALGLKRQHNRRKESEKYSDYSSSYDSYLGTSESSSSSGGRTRYSRAPPRSVGRSMSRR